jgi:hypothetical protein
MELKRKLENDYNNRIIGGEGPKYIKYNQSGHSVKSASNDKLKTKSSPRHVKRPWVIIDYSTKSSVVEVLNKVMEQQVAGIGHEKKKWETAGCLDRLIKSIGDKLDSAMLPAGIKPSHFNYEFMVQETAKLRDQLVGLESQVDSLEVKLNHEQHLIEQLTSLQYETTNASTDANRLHKFEEAGYEILDSVEGIQLADTAVDICLESSL